MAYRNSEKIITKCSTGSDDVMESGSGDHSLAASDQLDMAPQALTATACSNQPENEGLRRGSDGDYQLVPQEVPSSSTNRYEVLELLGRGSFGQTPKCRNKNTNEIVAIKFLKNLPRFARQGQIEASILARLSQESCEEWNLVVWYETFLHRSHMCFVFEMLEQSLYDFLKENRFSPLPLKCIRPILHQLLTALLKLKQLGLIHTDLKPENIMLVDPVRQPYRVKLIDFGNAIDVKDTTHYTCVQTRNYRSPKTILGRPCCETIDTWSLGCVIAELFLGRPLYSSEYDQVRYILQPQGLTSERTFNSVLESGNGDHSLATGDQLDTAPQALTATACSNQPENKGRRYDTVGDYRLKSHEILESWKYRYEVLDFLGRGVFGQVVRCLNRFTLHIVAIKILKRQPRFTQQGQIEASILTQLSQNSGYKFNLVHCFEIFMHRSHMCFVFEMLQQSLYHFHEQYYFAPFPLVYVRPVLHQLLTALYKLKELGLIHTDLKPENIMLVDPVRQPYRVKLIDFGNAIYVKDTTHYKCVQTRNYRAPEVILGLPFCEAIDMWSLGCVIAEFFLGEILYPGSSDYDQIRIISRTQGLPSESMLYRALNTTQFFHRDGLSPWRLKTPEEYEAETGIKSKERQRYIFRCLEDIQLINLPTELPEHELVAEKADRREFVLLLKKMLAMDPLNRITPNVALNHAFLTMAHFRDYENCDNIQYDMYMMKLYHQYSCCADYSAAPPADSQVAHKSNQQQFGVAPYLRNYVSCILFPSSYQDEWGAHCILPPVHAINQYRLAPKGCNNSTHTENTLCLYERKNCPQ